MSQVCSNYIGGEWIKAAGEKVFASLNPATGEEIGLFSAPDERDGMAAIDTAAASFPTWAATTPGQRATILFKAADILERRGGEIARLITLEEGKTLAESTIEVKRSAANIRYYAGAVYDMNGETYPSDEPGSLLSTIREPLGVVSVVTPWNFPLSIPVRKIVPALATGNTVVFKPASLTPAVGRALVEILVEAGVPGGALNLVTGAGSAMGSVLVENGQVRALTFTGSNPVGAALARAVGPSCRTQLEMGGENPLVVMDDADLELAAQIAVRGAFGLSGQACTGTSRIIVLEQVKEQFLERLVNRTEKLVVGNGLEQGVTMGPLASQGQLETVTGYIELGLEEGATLLTGGKRLQDGALAQGYFLSPAIFTDATPHMRIAREEIFGPVLAVISAASFEEALAIANDTEFGLSAAICTRSLRTAHRFAQQVQAGMVKINKPTTGVNMNAPFGGVKKSSTDTYREQGRVALEFYTRLKTIDMAI